MYKEQKHTRLKFFSIALSLIILLTEVFIYVPKVQAENKQEVTEENIKPEPSKEPEESSTPEPSIEPDESSIPGSSIEPEESSMPEPSIEPEESSTPEPSIEPESTSTPEPSIEPVKNIKHLDKVKGVSLTRYSTHSIKVTWKKNKKAKFYRVYYSRKKNGKGHLAGVTKNLQYRVKNLKNNTDYYFYVIAGKTKKVSENDSYPSGIVHMKTRKYIRKTIFAGDSITKGIMDYGMLNRFSIKGKKKVVAAISLNTITFHTRRVFGGMTGLQKIIAEKPSRVYMMLGINEVHYRRINDMLSDYRSMIQAIKKSSPGTDIVLCAISPVTRAERARHSGFWQLPVFNRRLKGLADKTNTRYFDYTGFLQDSGGYLKTQYAERDGYHWIPSVYPKFASVVSKYDKSLDE